MSELTFTVATTREERDQAVSQMKAFELQSLDRERRLRRVEYEREQLLEHKEKVRRDTFHLGIFFFTINF